jgi:SAM-dependent methyltransferase
MNSVPPPLQEVVPRPIIEVLSPHGQDEAIQRMKVHGLAKALSGRYQFKRFDRTGDNPDGVLINGMRLNILQDESLKEVLANRARHSAVMMLLPDLYSVTVTRLNAWAAFVDVFLVATQELASQIRSLTGKDARVLEDPIDFGFLNSVRNPKNPRTTAVLWFGYPESYSKSMGVYEPTLHSLAASGEINYTIVTDSKRFGDPSGNNILQYDHDTFPEMLKEFDICVTSHTPLDFSMSTFWKSENKAVLAINRGLAVVASRTPAHQRLFTECGLQDFLFDNAQELTNAIRRLSDPAERIRYLDKAQDFVLRNYSIIAVARKWESIFDDLFQKKLRARCAIRTLASSVPTVIGEEKIVPEHDSRLREPCVATSQLLSVPSDVLTKRTISMHPSAMNNCDLFFKTYAASFNGQPKVRVIEIGSQDVNGSLRSLAPANFDYVGVDFVDGKGVDVVLDDPYALPFESESADLVLSSSCFEHSEMFWIVFLEIMRILKPSGLFYLNVPSNGTFHRYPVDCWRFYPDSGKALVSWARRNSIDAVLLESYISDQQTYEWNDFVAVFLKDQRHIERYPSRILDSFQGYRNGLKSGLTSFLKPTGPSEDQRKLQVIKRIIENKIKAP